MNKAQQLLNKLNDGKMFSDYQEYKAMLLKKGFTKEFLDKHDSYIRKSFDMDVNIIELTRSLKDKQDNEK